MVQLRGNRSMFGDEKMGMVLTLNGRGEKFLQTRKDQWQWILICEAGFLSPVFSPAEGGVCI